MGKKRKSQEKNCDREEKSHHVTESIEEPMENLSNHNTYLKKKKKKKDKKGEKEIIPDCSDSQIVSNEPEETSKSETSRKKKKSASEGEICDENETLVKDQETKKKKKKKKDKSEGRETHSLGKSEKVLQDDSTINGSLITNDSECKHSHSEAKIKKKKKKSKDKINEFEMCESSQDITAESINKEPGRSVKSESDEQTKKKKKKKRKCEVEATSSESVTGEHGSCDKLATEFNSRKDKKKKKKKKTEQETDVNESVVERVESAAKCETGNSKKNKKKNKLGADMEVKNEDKICSDTESSNSKKKKGKKRKKSEDDTNQEMAAKLDDEDKTETPKKKKKDKHINDAMDLLNNDHSTKVEQTKQASGKPDSGLPDKNYSTEETTESASMANGTKNASSCGQWGTANLGSSERNNKFLRLLGGFKKASADSGSEVPETKIKFNQALSADREKNLFNQLESQFERARNFSLARKNNMGGGLGYEPPPGANKKFYIDTNKTNSVKFND